MNTEKSPRLPDRDRNADGRPENARPRDQFGAPLPRDAVNQLVDRVEPADVCTSVAQAQRLAVELFDQQRFFEAHEFFEWAWKGPHTADEDRDFYKGLAQIAVGYTHTQRGNATGARSLLDRGIDHVSPYAPTHNGVDVARVTKDAANFREGIGATAPAPATGFPTFPVQPARHD